MYNVDIKNITETYKLNSYSFDNLGYNTQLNIFIFVPYNPYKL